MYKQNLISSWWPEIQKNKGGEIQEKENNKTHDDQDETTYFSFLMLNFKSDFILLKICYLI